MTTRLQLLEEEYVGPDLDRPNLGCTRCEILCESRTSIVFGEGHPNPDILILGESPGYYEDEAIRPFVGKAGVLLDNSLSFFARKEADWLYRMGGKISRGHEPKPIESDQIRSELIESEKIYYSNAVLCRPEENRDPTKAELDNCRDRLMQLIYLLDPLVILALGKTAGRSVLGKVVKIGNDRGQIRDVEIPGQVGGIRYPMALTFHPSFVLRMSDFVSPTGPGQMFFKDLQRVFDLLDDTRHRVRGENVPNRRRW